MDSEPIYKQNLNRVTEVKSKVLQSLERYLLKKMDEVAKIG